MIAISAELMRMAMRLSMSISGMSGAGDSTTKSRSPYHRHRQCARGGKSFSSDIMSCHTIETVSKTATTIHTIAHVIDFGLYI